MYLHSSKPDPKGKRCTPRPAGTTIAKSSAVLTNHAVEELAREAGLRSYSIVIARPGRPEWEAVRIDADADRYPASMIKVPLVLAALTDVADGRLHLDDRIEVTRATLTSNDAPSPFTLGYWGRLDEICLYAISRSDNVATNMLFDIVGRERATAIMRDRYDLRDTAFHRKLSGSEPLIVDPGWDGIHRNRHSASDCARLFDLIARDQVPFAAHIRDYLAEQVWNDKLTRGLRPGDRFYHKTGDTDDVTHDGGILTLTDEDRTYILVVYTTMPSTEANNKKFAPFMSQLLARL